MQSKYCKINANHQKGRISNGNQEGSSKEEGTSEEDRKKEVADQPTRQL
jgi:hypothetical protein